MSGLTKLFRGASLIAMMPVFAHAAGTYYTGSTYQSPQQRYTAPGYSAAAYNTQPGYTNQRGIYNNNAGANNAAYNARAPMTAQGANQNTRAKSDAAARNTQNKKKGFYASAGLSHEFAQWEFEMKNAGSILHYNNISWNVLDIGAGYDFAWGKTAMRVDGGFKYGIQSGEAHMTDDDISNGGTPTLSWYNTADGSYIGTAYNQALATGTSKSGDMLGFNLGFGLPDFFKIGNARITPSIGYRYLKYKLETKDDYGLSIETAACFQIEGSKEVECDPLIIVYYGDKSKPNALWREEVNGGLELGNGATEIDTAGTFYYYLPGVSHSYETTWAGPYIAMDVDYPINANNAVNARVELGFPGYKSTGDQPYRVDWAHPKSVEDKAGMFGAIHFGMGANWTTALTNSLSLTVGLTYDYYNVNGADAKTYANAEFYQQRYQFILDEWIAAGRTENDMLGKTEGVQGDAEAITINNLKADGWTISQDNEIKSFYKSMGIHVGLSARF